MTESSTEEENLYQLDFNTSSSISKTNLKFLILYIPIFWLGGILALSAWYGLITHFPLVISLVLLPFLIFMVLFVFIFGCVLSAKLFLILINLIHKPKQGIFRAEEGNTDYEFWRLRIELKKLGVWLLNHTGLPWAEVWAFRLFGVQMDFSSHLNDAWVDIEFIKFGRKVTVGQGAVVMSSMIVGKYLIIKESVFDDYTVIGGVSTIAPGTLIGKDTVIGALSSTNFKQVLEQGWIYFGIPGIKLKKNKFAEERRDIIVKRIVDDETKYEETQEVNIDKDKAHLVKKGEDI
ncbi:MAG: hypothetical protein EU548_06220 [Promethearchaeota archaeon]|nr:MAG: hypothetical protein EU548_06220 [Candidatus Lokiarchaeota archaeon]